MLTMVSGNATELKRDQGQNGCRMEKQRHTNLDLTSKSSRKYDKKVI